MEWFHFLTKDGLFHSVYLAMSFSKFWNPLIQEIWFYTILQTKIACYCMDEKEQLKTFKIFSEGKLSLGYYENTA